MSEILQVGNFASHRCAGVDSGRILRFSLRPGSGVKNVWRNGPGSGVTF